MKGLNFETAKHDIKISKTSLSTELVWTHLRNDAATIVTAGWWALVCNSLDTVLHFTVITGITITILCSCAMFYVLTFPFPILTPTDDQGCTIRLPPAPSSQWRVTPIWAGLVTTRHCRAMVRAITQRSPDTGPSHNTHSLVPGKHAERWHNSLVTKNKTKTRVWPSCRSVLAEFRLIIIIGLISGSEETLW